MVRHISSQNHSSTPLIWKKQKALESFVDIELCRTLRTLYYGEGLSPLAIMRHLVGLGVVGMDMSFHMEYAFDLSISDSMEIRNSAEFFGRETTSEQLNEVLLENIAQSELKGSYRISVRTARPDFRIIVDMFMVNSASDVDDVDTDVNCANPADRNWTELHISSRNTDGRELVVNPVSKEPLLLEVSSDDLPLASLVALYLAEHCMGQIFDGQGDEVSPDFLLNRLRFNDDMISGLDRARCSVWHKATIGNPYPNLQSDTSP